jgi:hypothetical protein
VAKDALAIYEARNIKREDFDADKVKPAQGMLLSTWLDSYLELVKHTPSGGTKKAQCIPLKRVFGGLLVTEVNRVRILAYKAKRLTESLTRHGEAVEGTRVKGSTVNREISCLVAALNFGGRSGNRRGRAEDQERAGDPARADPNHR